jgi:hypothetical protein
VKSRGRQRISHPEIVQISVNTKEAELKAFAIRELELRGERSSLREEDRHGESEACHYSLESVPAPSLPVCGEARRHVYARRAGSL